MPEYGNDFELGDDWFDDEDDEQDLPLENLQDLIVSISPLKNGDRQDQDEDAEADSSLLDIAPPGLARYLLWLIVPKYQQDEFIGDLEEVFFGTIYPQHGSMYSRRWYWFQTISCAFFVARDIIAGAVKHMVKFVSLPAAPRP